MADDNQGHLQHTVLVQLAIKNAESHHLPAYLAGPPRQGIKPPQHPCGCGSCPWEEEMGFNLSSC